MSLRQRLHARHAQVLDSLRLHLSRPDALLQLSALGILTGLATGVVIVAFRWCVEQAQSSFLPGGVAENFEALELHWRALLPLAGGLTVGLLFQWLARGGYVVGVVHVMERMAYHQGHLQARGMLLQFLGGLISIASGQSVGREGPGVHLGAATGSLLGRRLALPNNTIRTLVGCGTAAAIAASFNTPLAGVIFALEVVMMEYTLASFTPVILAAVSATSLAVAVYGPDPAFDVTAPELVSLWELPFILFLGMILGAVAAGFIRLVKLFAALGQPWPYWLRTSTAGLIAGLCALAYPQIMGVGYDSVGSALLGQLGLGLLLGIAVFKLLATAAAVGLGVPAGLIGPTIVIGATLGGFMGTLAHGLFPQHSADGGFYALLGMGAMMGASLQAPLAALTAMLELTGSLAIILPGMLAVVAAGLTSSELFRQSSVFLELLRARGLDYDSDPIMLALRRVGVASAMDRRVEKLPRRCPRATAETVLRQEPEWILVTVEEGAGALLPAIDLARRLAEQPEEQELDLVEIPARRLQARPIDLQASLHEALERLEKTKAEALYVERSIAPGIRKIYGVLTRERIDAAYKL